jgi:hypothetical protein
MPTYLLSPTVICRRGRASSALLFGSALLLLGGCMAEKKRPVIAWRTASIVRPIVPTPQAADANTLPEVDSIPSLVLPAPNVTFLPPRTSPPRPRVASQSATAGNAKDEGPLIVPQISAAEFANAQQETNASLSIAEKNLNVVQGKTLNAAQTDMSNKVKSFMGDAREAARNGDWARARSLARKAQAISEELARSL